MKSKNVVRVIMLLSVIVISGELSLASKPEDEAKKSAEQWLALVDAGKFAESWETASAYFQTSVSREQWLHSLTAIRKPLGDLISRKFKSATYARSLPGAPDGQYVILQFNTAFTNKKTAVETVTPMVDKDGNWRVSGYFIR